MRLSGFLELPQLADESPSPTWRARGGRWVCFAGLSSSISFTIGTSPMGSATCVEQRGRCPGLVCLSPSGSPEFREEPKRKGGGKGIQSTADKLQLFPHRR